MRSRRCRRSSISICSHCSKGSGCGSISCCSSSSSSGRIVAAVVVVVVVAALCGVVVGVVQSFESSVAEVFKLRLMAESAAECGFQNPLRICSAHDSATIGVRV